MAKAKSTVNNTPKSSFFSSAQQKSSPQTSVQIDITKKPVYPTCPIKRNNLPLPVPTPPVTKELALSSNMEEKIKWAIDDCQVILINFGIPKNGYMVKTNPANTNSADNYKLLITIHSGGIYHLAFQYHRAHKNTWQPNSQEFIDALIKVTETAYQEIKQKYQPCNTGGDDKGYVGGTLNYHSNNSTFKNREIYFSQKAIERRIQQEWQKQQFEDRIINLPGYAVD